MTHPKWNHALIGNSLLLRVCRGNVIVKLSIIRTGVGAELFSRKSPEIYFTHTFRIMIPDLPQMGKNQLTVDVSDRFSVHHQESSTVYTAIGVCHTGYAEPQAISITSYYIWEGD